MTCDSNASNLTTHVIFSVFDCKASVAYIGTILLHCVFVKALDLCGCFKVSLCLFYSTVRRPSNLSVSSDLQIEKEGHYFKALSTTLNIGLFLWKNRVSLD